MDTLWYLHTKQSTQQQEKKNYWSAKTKHESQKYYTKWKKSDTKATYYTFLWNSGKGQTIYGDKADQWLPGARVQEEGWQ